MKEIAPGIWHWTARHPEWPARRTVRDEGLPDGTPKGFGDEVGSYLAHHRGATVIIDPLLTEDLDGHIDGDVLVAITIPYHVRDAAEVVRRYGGTVVGHPDLRRRLPDDIPFATGDERIELHPVKRLKEQPVGLPDLSALAFGDRVVGVDGALRVWIQRELKPGYWDQQAKPSLRPLLEVDAEYVLTTHGAPVLRNGRSALAEALGAGPWYHRSS
jgi:hypothetical protein